MREIHWHSYLLPSPFVIIASLVGVYTFLKLRDIFTLLTTALDTSTRQIAVVIADRFFIIFFGSLLLIFILFAGNYLRTGAEKGSLLERALRLIGRELLVLFPIQLGLQLSPAASTAHLTGYTIAAAALAAGLVLNFLSMQQKKRLR